MAHSGKTDGKTRHALRFPSSHALWLEVGATCSGKITTENVKFAECFYICRVYSLGHSANKFFAECCAKNTRQKKHSAKRRFAECQKKNTRHRGGLPSVFFFALDKEIKSFFWERRRRKKMKKNFAECPDPGHSTKK